MVLKLKTIEQFEKVIQEQEKVFVLIHSTTCPISMNAYDQFNNFLYERDIDGYYLTMQEARELSDYIEKKTGVKHESPQAFYFVEGTAKWNASHQHITVSSLSSAEE